MDQESWCRQAGNDKELGLLRGAIHRLHMVVLIHYLGLVKFVLVVIMKNLSLVFEKRVFQITGSNKQTARAVIEEEVMKLKGAVSTSVELGGKLAESNRA